MKSVFQNALKRVCFLRKTHPKREGFGQLPDCNSGVDERVSALVRVARMYGCAPCGNRAICSIWASIINPGRERAWIINAGSAA